MEKKKANDYQVGGEHYKSPIQHWDYVWANDLDYFQAQITKYVVRWKKKAGLADLEKARHFLEKYIELIKESEGSKFREVLEKHNPRMYTPFGYNPEEELGDATSSSDS